MKYPIVASLLAVLTTVGCAPMTINDDLEDSLAVVAGAPVALELVPVETYLDEVDGWSDEDVQIWIESLDPMDAWSSDPEVFELEDQTSWDHIAQGIAVQEGSTQIDFEDPWTGSGSLSVAVLAADRLELRAFDPYAVDETGWEPVEAVQVVVGGLVQLETRAFREDIPLSGAHVLEVSHSRDLQSEVTAIDNHDALTLRALTPGEHVVSVFVAGEALGELRVTAVGPEAAASMQLLQVGEEQPDAEVRSVRAVRVADADGEAILGFRPTWTIDGEPVGEGDTVYYNYDAEGALPVEVQLGELTIQATLPAESAGVTTTRAGGALGPLVGLLALGLLVVGRERT